MYVCACGCVRVIVVQELLSHPAVPQMYMWEDGHILDLAAANGDLKMVNLLLEFNRTVGPSSLAHAAHFNHTDVMEVSASVCVCVYVAQQL